MQGPTITPTVFDVDDATFDTAVIERSRQVPVVVDLWAAWCGPCRTLGPMIEDAVTARQGAVLLAKVDVDANPQTAQRFRVQGIPYVLGFRGGEVVDQFTGVIPQPQLEAFLGRLAPSEADLAAADARHSPGPAAVERLRAALADSPDHRDASVALAELIVDDDPDEALRLVAPHRPDPAAEAVAVRAELAGHGNADRDTLRRAAEAGEADAVIAFARHLAARSEFDDAFTVLLDAVRDGGPAREPAREQLLALFTMLGDDDRVAAARQQLARALY